MQIERDTHLVLAKLPTTHYLLCKVKRWLEPLWMKLGTLETRLLAASLSCKPVDRPIYVMGLARSGTTITLDFLSKHGDVATHRYHDMVQPYLPFVWNWVLRRLPLPAESPKERLHKDGLYVTRESPEAVEEVIWNKFFPDLYDESCSAVLDANTSNPAFHSFYRATIVKLLLAYQRPRYLSKANYNLTRLAYLVRLFPDARIVVMVRRPVAHFASWVKQHELFLRTQAHDPRWIETIRMVGHCEFGHDNRFVNAGDTELVREIRKAWDCGERAYAFGLYWASMYGQVFDLVERDPLVRAAVLFVRYEDLCANPRITMERMLAHVQLDVTTYRAVFEEYEGKLAAPQYYRSKLDSAELQALDRTTQAVATRFGYAD